MATSAYHMWVNGGRFWKLATPIAQLRAWAEDRGIPVLGTIGNIDHLTADFPEDHTPFSFTAWPVPLPGPYVTAIDLANVDDLGSRVLAAARAGRLPWLKYLNASGKHWAWADGFRGGRVSSDHHVHISIFSDELETDIGDFDLALDPREGDMPYRDWPQADRDALLADIEVSVNRVVWQKRIASEALNTPPEGMRHDNWWVKGGQAALQAVRALSTRLDHLAPGIAQEVSEAVQRITAEDVADELEVRPKGA